MVKKASSISSFKTTKKKVKPASGRPKKFSVTKETPIISTLRSFGIYVVDVKKAEMLFEKIYQEAKTSGEPISIVAKRYREKVNKLKEKK